MDCSKEKLPEIERFPTNYYEDGIELFKSTLMLHKIVGLQHWQGNTDYTIMDAIEGKK